MINQVFLEVVDQTVAARPDTFRDEIVNANDEDILVVRAVEYDDFAASRRGLVRSPQKIVRSLFRGGLFEGCNAATLRVHGAQNVIDGAVFAAGVEGLKADEKRMAVFSVKQVLQLSELFLVMLDLIGSGLLAFVTAAEGRVKFLEFDLASQFDLEFFQIAHSDSPLRRG